MGMGSYSSQLGLLLVSSGNNHTDVIYSAETLRKVTFQTDIVAATYRKLLLTQIKHYN